MDSLFAHAYAAEDFRKNGHLLIDVMADYLARTTDTTNEVTIPWQEPHHQLAYWKEDFQKPLLPEPNQLFEDVIARSLHLHSRRAVGHQTAATLPVTMLAGLVGEMLNNGMAIYELGMVGNAMERIVTEHLARTLGFGREASGLVTSGATLGTLTALLAARAAFTDSWQEGMHGQQLAIMVSEEAHYCIDRAARVMGFGAAGVIKIPVDGQFAVRADLLEACYQQAVAEGKRVICVVGCACTTSTGTFDDLEAIASFCETHKLWFHVDGAHGAPVAFSPKFHHLVKGIERADSVVVDFHKMMLTPSLATALIFKNGSNAYKTFSQKAQYLWADHETGEWYNSSKRTFECTKTMDVLKVYTIFRMYGDEIFKQHIEKTCGLAQEFAALIQANPNFELAYSPQCNMVCFRLATQSDEVNKAVRQQILEEGRFYMVSTKLNGKYYLRTTLINPLTGIEELEELLATIEQAAAEVTAQQAGIVEQAVN